MRLVRWVGVLFVVCVYPLALTLMAASYRLNACEADCTLPAYDRDAWGSWLDLDGDCQDARSEAIRARADHTAGPCRVVYVELTDPYTGERYAGPASLLDVDHVVAVAEAHRSGGWSWSTAQRMAFVNDPRNLVPTHRSVNRSKSDRDIGEWLPPDRDAWCWYGRTWLAVKARWRLSMDGEEVAGVARAMEGCEAP